MADTELLDFVDLLGYEAAGVEDVLGHPVLLSPHRRQLMYYQFDTDKLLANDRRNWLQANAYPAAGWILFASGFDPILKKIIAYQAKQFISKNQWKRYGDDYLVRCRRSFELDFFGALHFSSVVTGHYSQHFKAVTQGNPRQEIKCRVDYVLKNVLPRLLTRRYNAMFVHLNN
ncbi:uncharacterized protein LOC123398665 [Hordeum vulgare subsp. vulgare]|uniref:uncharacterized protein LOC123398665 n=1 Tax=Hordeum vulgare subsp. vulgare TaxID=112509 RepID=UPI001D1A4A3D|nr:uncharacterized protein LOC123398665 [Hordeum vulgare subsp. vulgare]